MTLIDDSWLSVLRKQQSCTILAPGRLQKAKRERSQKFRVVKGLVDRFLLIFTSPNAI